MSTVNKFNATKLNIHIAENGKRAEKKRICQIGGLSESTLNKALRGHMPDFSARYGIYKATGIKLSDEDDFPPLQAMNAS